MLTSVVFFNSLTVSKVESFKEITNIQRWIESRMLLIWENGQRKRKYGDKKRGKTQRWAHGREYLSHHWPHVDKILSQGDGLAVAADGDGAVQVGRRVPVLAVRDPDHRPADLSEEGFCQIFQPLRSYWSMFVPTWWTWGSQIILMFTAVRGNTIWHIVSVSSLGGIFCVSQIICEVFGLGLNKEGLLSWSCTWSQQSWSRPCRWHTRLSRWGRSSRGFDVCSHHDHRLHLLRMRALKRLLSNYENFFASIFCRIRVISCWIESLSGVKVPPVSLRVMWQIPCLYFELLSFYRQIGRLS